MNLRIASIVAVFMLAMGCSAQDSKPDKITPVPTFTQWTQEGCSYVRQDNSLGTTLLVTRTFTSQHNSFIWSGEPCGKLAIELPRGNWQVHANVAANISCIVTSVCEGRLLIGRNGFIDKQALSGAGPGLATATLEQGRRCPPDLTTGGECWVTIWLETRLNPEAQAQPPDAVVVSSDITLSVTLKPWQASAQPS